MELNGSCFKLRSWKNGDEVSLLKYADNPNVTRYLENRFPSPYTAADAAEWVNAQLLQPKPITNAALTVGDEVVGGIGITLLTDIYCKNARIGYWLGEPFWGKGIMTEALALFTNYIFDEFDVERLVAGIFASNPASAKVLLKAGYQQEGIFKKALYKNGLYDDELIFAKSQSN
ncbi:MAG: GNAT family N-acetyltransferase [Mucilaginibacter sp.]|uniref:GNAT family N-acetyltransferase n=1 Tax=Mucilaginibacter sp. TaxID=1882438 RepID=UPI0034E5E38D